MKKIIKILIISCLFCFKLSAQNKSFQSEDDVRIYMQDKWFSNPNGLKIKYGYISELNTYGISIKNKHDNTSYFINVNIQTMGSYAILSGMSTEDGSNFKLRLYRDKIIVGYGEPGELTFTKE